MVPHPAPASAQVLGVHPQTLGVPPPPQVSGTLQVPQLSWCPHPSSTVPQVAPRSAQVLAAHPQMFGLPPPPQVCGLWQDPQSSNVPHPSEVLPQVAASSSQVRGWQGVSPQVFGPLLPQNFPVGQAPQCSTPPHPFWASPHSAPSELHVCGTQEGCDPASPLVAVGPARPLPRVQPVHNAKADNSTPKRLSLPIEATSAINSRFIPAVPPEQALPNTRPVLIHGRWHLAGPRFGPGALVRPWSRRLWTRRAFRRGDPRRLNGAARNRRAAANRRCPSASMAGSRGIGNAKYDAPLAKSLIQIRCPRL